MLILYFIFHAQPAPELLRQLRCQGSVTAYVRIILMLCYYIAASEDVRAVQSLTPNDAVVWQIPNDVKSGQLPTYLIVHLFR